MTVQRLQREGNRRASRFTYSLLTISAMLAVFGNVDDAVDGDRISLVIACCSGALMLFSAVMVYVHRPQTAHD